MIPFDFIYCRPDTMREAADVYAQLSGEGKRAVYYGGGSEIITMARAGSLKPDAVIDLKGIPECSALELLPDRLVIGGANSLNTVKESKRFPLLSTACGRISDHTNQCRITLGGNLCGTILYREAVLPLLLADAQVLLYGPAGSRLAGIHEVFDRLMKLAPGEFVAQVHIPAPALHLPYVHIKKTAQEKIDYPLVNVTAVVSGSELRAAFSGLCSFPFRSLELERLLNDRAMPRQDRVNAVPALLPEAPRSDAEGSGEYRLFVLKNTLENLLEEWERGAI